MTSPKRFTHLTFEERQLLEDYLKDGKSYRFMSRALLRADVTLSLEVKRNGGRENYCAVSAQKKYAERKLSVCSEQQDKIWRIHKEEIISKLS